MAKIRDLLNQKYEAAEYMKDEITHIIKTYGKRPPASEGEKKAVEYMEEVCKPMTHSSKIEPFTLHPSAFYGWIYIDVAIMLIGFILAFFIPVLTVLCTFMFMYIMIREFVFYQECVDPLFPKKTSYNMWALRKAKVETRQRIFYNGHPDAAQQWTFNHYFGGIGFVAHFIISMIGIVYLFCMSVASIIVNFVVTKSAQGFLSPVKFGSGAVPQQIMQILLLLTLIFLPGWLLMLWLWDERIVVDGANDNLTGCYLGIAVLKFMHDNNIELDYTDVGVAITGSEEAGLRGGYAFAKEHKYDYLDVPTVFIGYDTMHEEKYLYVNVSDLNTTVKSNKYACDLYVQACKNTGVHVQTGTVPLGATDNAAFNKNGLISVGVTALNHNLQDYYHTVKDNYDNLDADCLAACFAASVECAALLEEGWKRDELLAEFEKQKAYCEKTK